MFDIIVIGEGLTGVVAALEARKRGAKVAIASRGYGATALCTGALDLAYAPALSASGQGERTLAEHVMDIIAHRPRHPYAILGLERVFAGMRAGFAVMVDALGPELAPRGPLNLEATNAALPSSLGALMPAGASLTSHAGLDFLAPPRGAIGVLQLLGDPDFAAKRVIAGLRADAGNLTDARPELVEIAVELDLGLGALHELGPVQLARALDDQHHIERLGASLAKRVEGLAALIVPPVLGLDRSAQSRATLAKHLGVPVVEALAHTPSVPGLRFQRALTQAAVAAGVQAVGPIAQGKIEGGRATSVVTSDGLELRTGAVILATGRFINGGIRFDQMIREPIFGLPVVGEVGVLEIEDPSAVLRESPVESHPLMTAGVAVDPTLRPLREGRMAAVNLFAAGIVLGGFASRYALCADGIALASGHLAASEAMRGLGGAR